MPFWLAVFGVFCVSVFVTGLLTFLFGLPF